MVPAPGAPGCPAESRAAGPQVPASTREAADDSPPLWVSSRPGTASPGAGGSALRYVERGRMAAFLEAGLARVLFYPTLLYTVFRGKAPGRAHRDWYHRIDPTVLLGALPLRSMTRRVSRAGRPAWERASAAPAPRPCLSPLFASAAGAGRERARGDHHERGVRDEVPVQLRQGAQLEPRGGCRGHRQDPVTHLHQTWPI
ncbi:phosphatidylglycerophosphatase and protein-tyrosine phosphatase 1 isoform X2 [Diceros bicornis minor]|uniref:phosphatidylglycerophosphatase and protein-tyrosine phosphatase 1 isoform X2 n=1 Tax=Diceros bicornis minor TaxID=77932 RepID=UPI0026EAB88D|nr:phosphatidylglycerophosphatase and protein-tyrosine phosphatase 1 isoform X2 [Diceros bicornis minor]